MLSRPLARISAALVGAVMIATITGTGGVASAAPTPSPTPTSPAKSGSAANPNKATFGLQPFTKGRPDLRSQFSYQMSAGGNFSDNVAVVNFGAQPLTIQVYTADLNNASDGNLAVAAQNAPSDDAGAWVKLQGGNQTVHLPASSTKNGPGRIVLPVSIHVPPSASPGDHGAAVVASLATLGRNPKGENVRLLQRVALRVFIRVNGDIRPHLSITGLSMKYHDNWNPLGPGSTELTYTLRNDGNIKLGARQQISISGWFGNTGALAANLVASAPVANKSGPLTLPDIPLLLPGSAVVVHQKIARTWPQIRLTAKITVIPLRQVTDADPGLAPTTTSVSTWAIPWTLLALIVVMLAGGLTIWMRLRRRRKRYTGGSHKMQKRKPTGPSKPASHKKPREPIGTALRVTVSVLALVGAATAVTARATADNIPFQDPNANGYIGFCNADGKQVTSGKIGDAPFAALAVSSSPAPAGYVAGYGKAQLNVYVPREGTEPREWTGKGLTASSAFTNTAHPMAEGTSLDAALVDLTSVAPPKWQGLVQLRMYFTAINRPQHVSPYPATIVRVTGDSWAMVSGGPVDCHAGKATSVERLALPASAFSTAARSTPGAGPSGSSHGKGGSSGSGQPSPSGSIFTGNDDAAAAGANKSSSDSSALVWTLVALAVAVAGGIGVWRWRRARAG